MQSRINNKKHNDCIHFFASLLSFEIIGSARESGNPALRATAACLEKLAIDFKPIFAAISFLSLKSEGAFGPANFDDEF